jgi:hypothetical protein
MWSERMAGRVTSALREQGILSTKKTHSHKLDGAHCIRAVLFDGVGRFI